MAGIAKILQTVGKGFKNVANSKAGKALGKGVNTIFTPVKKAHQAQGGKNFLDPNGSTLGYYLGLLGSIATGAGMSAGSLVVSSEAKKHFNDDREKYEKQILVASKLADATVGIVAGLILGGPIGALVLGATAGLVPKDFIYGKERMWSCGETLYTFGDVREKHRTERKDARAQRKAEIEEQKAQKIQQEKQKSQDYLKEIGPKVSAFVAQTDSVPVNTAVGDTTLVVPAASLPLDSAQVDSVLTDSVSTDSVSTDPSSVPLQEPVVEEPVVPVEESVQTNFWNGELNEIEVESIKVDKGDCLWNIAKRELQKVNQGKRITNAQIVKQVKEFGRLNPELFGENPSYESLDFIKAGVTLKLSA